MVVRVPTILKIVELGWSRDTHSHSDDGEGARRATSAVGNNRGGTEACYGIGEDRTRRRRPWGGASWQRRWVVLSWNAG